MLDSAEKIIECNWEEVKSEMKKTWRNLTDTQVKAINNYDDLVKQLKKAYDITDEEKIFAKIDKFIDKFDLQPNLTRFEEFKKSLYEGAENAKEKIEHALKVSAEGIKDKADNWSTSAVAYSKGNPFKVLVLGVIAAVAIKKMLEKKE